MLGTCVAGLSLAACWGEGLWGDTGLSRGESGSERPSGEPSGLLLSDSSAMAGYGGRVRWVGVGVRQQETVLGGGRTKAARPAVEVEVVVLGGVCLAWLAGRWQWMGGRALGIAIGRPRRVARLSIEQAGSSVAVGLVGMGWDGMGWA